MKHKMGRKRGGCRKLKYRVLVRWKSPWYVLYLHCMFNAGGVVNGNDRY
jgi:hypothetical protein